MEEVYLRNVSVTDVGFVLFLKSEKMSKILPIFIGLIEAQSMSSVLSGEVYERPMTYHLFGNILSKLNVKLEKIEIVKMIGDVFYANIHLLDSSKKKIIIDSRPSDAIILSTIFRTKVFVKKELIEKKGIDEKNEDKKMSNKLNKTESFDNEKISRNKNEELGVYWKLLEDAIKDERYEEASRLRKKIDLIMDNGEKE